MLDGGERKKKKNDGRLWALRDRVTNGDAPAAAS
jgi:hypothetical protein